MEHEGAVTALLFLPVGAVAGLVLLDLGARQGVGWAGRLRSGYLRLTGAERLALLLLLVTATVHAALVPAHWDEPSTAALFLLFALGAAGTAALALFGYPRWRPVAIVLLAGAVVAYAAYLGGGVEEPDALGLAIKAVEVAAVATLVVSSHRRSRRYTST